jgi:hypothetical protein
MHQAVEHVAGPGVCHFGLSVCQLRFVSGTISPTSQCLAIQSSYNVVMRSLQREAIWHGRHVRSHGNASDTVDWPTGSKTFLLPAQQQNNRHTPAPVGVRETEAMAVLQSGGAPLVTHSPSCTPQTAPLPPAKGRQRNGRSQGTLSGRGWSASNPSDVRSNADR